MTAERLAEQIPCVEKATKTKLLNKYSEVYICGENTKIIKSLNGELKNTHNAVFKNCLGKKACEHCGAIGVLDRAHMQSRLEIIKEVLDDIHPDPKESIEIRKIMMEFVLRHKTVGVWMLCKKCHKELG